jgi:hypothetical protein
MLEATGSSTIEKIWGRFRVSDSTTARVDTGEIVVVCHNLKNGRVVYT